MKRLLLLLIAILLLSIALLGCNRSTNISSLKVSQDNADRHVSEKGTLEVNFGTGTTTGVYYPLGATLAKIWNDNVPNIKVSSQATDASVQNLNLMMEGRLNMGFTTVGVLYEAYNGTGKFKDRPYKDVRVIASLYPNVGQVVVRKGSKIESINDFKGKGFVPGAPGSSTKELSEQVLSAYNLSFNDVKAQYVGFTEVTELMRNNQIDGAIIEAGIPASAVVEITIGAGNLISIDDEHIEKITTQYPWLYKHTIPAKTYEGQVHDITTVSQKNMIVVPKDMPEEKVYELTKALWENIDSITSSISAVKNMKLETATEGLADIPLHPGAEKYYKEKGVLK
ncbi:MAG TPA: TAXI family TRAP transporter solute-binding subunit [Bacillales bacterium]|nr:TAXI family TRAP transporter solute-binding subunit [Bacillales bacterium]